MRNAPFLLGVALAASITSSSVAESTAPLLPRGAVWNYLDNGIDAGNAWRAPDFDDSSWQSGPGQLGYGDGDEATVVGFGPEAGNKYITTYFRTRFAVADAGSISNLNLRVLRDDGVVVYINGTEAYRDNLPPGPVAFNTLALGPNSDENAYVSVTIPAEALVAGENVIAAEVHQSSPVSSDLGFDLELSAGGSIPPARSVVNVVATDAQASEASVVAAIDFGRFVIRRTPPLDFALPVNVRLSGTASNGVDYYFISNQVTLPRGVAEMAVMVAPVFDTDAEGAETVILTIESPVCAAIAPPLPECYLVGLHAEATVVISDFAGPTNLPPRVEIQTPETGEMFGEGEDILIRAGVFDEDDGVVALEFFVDNSPIGEAEGPFDMPEDAGAITWENATVGAHVIRARATDVGGLSSWSAPVTIQVLPTDYPTNILISMGSVWRYWDAGEAPGAWREPAYSEHLWKSGAAELGYGDGDEATIVGHGPDPTRKNITTYFRRSFAVGDPASYSNLVARVVQDDGAVVYLNGIEIFRSNLPSGDIRFGTLALTAIEEQTHTFPVPGHLLVSGRNVLAVEMHQVNVMSSDISFDLELTAGGGTANASPSIRLNAPVDGAVYSAPAAIELRAYAEDREDGYELTVEFFEGSRSLGYGTFVPARCATPICPYYTLTWSNVPAGAYSITARAVDSAGASDVTGPTRVMVQGAGGASQEVHAVGIHTGADAAGNESQQNGHAAVHVDRPGTRVTLLLSAYWPVVWHVTASEGTLIEKVILGGYGRQTLDGAAGAQVIERFYDEGRGTGDYILTDYEVNSVQFLRNIRKLCALTGMDLSSFQGDYTSSYPSVYVVNNVQSHDHFKCDYPQPVDPSTLPNLNFRLDFYNWGSGDPNVYSQQYTLAGPTNGGRLLPGLRVVSDAGGRYFYGAEMHEMWRVDSQTQTVERMDLGSNVPELSWPTGHTFDSARNRILLVSLGGEGHLYSYDPTQTQWRLLGSMNNLDVNSLHYHPATDTLYAVGNTYEDYHARVIYALEQSGHEQGRIQLPTMPFNFGSTDYETELVSVGEYLVLLIEPNYRHYYRDDPPESRMYLIDPQTGEVRLTYRRALERDTDSDGVPDARDLCPGTPLHMPVDIHGCGSDQRDSDNDGVVDSRDACPGTESGGVVNERGCSIAQLCPCEGDWRNHVDYVRCAIEHAWDFYREGFFNRQQREQTIRAAARSTCGRHAGNDEPLLLVQPQAPDECASEGLRLVICGGRPGTYVVECSSDLVHWMVDQTHEAGLDEAEIHCPVQAGTTARYYRIRPLP